MAKYNYNKKVLKGLSVGPFLGEVKLRNKMIEEASDELPKFKYNANDIANKLHPGVQFGIIKKVINEPNAKTYIIEPNIKKGTKELAYFRAGQYVSIALEIGKEKLNKPYSLCSDPEDAYGEKDNTYAITVVYNKNGHASKYIGENWKVGTELTMSGPLGDFYYVSLRDAKHVVGVAGGSGVTPFVSMARAIVSKHEDFKLTLLYGCKNEESIIFKSELDKLVKDSKGKVEVIYVLSDENKSGYEHGFITSELVKKYAGKEDYTVYVCGPKAMYKFAKEEFLKLKLPQRRIRYELQGEFGDPAQDKNYDKKAVGKEFKLTVLVRGEKTVTTVKAEETIMQAIEKAGIRVPSDCRSGVCGWCHSRLVNGKVFIPESQDGRRMGDKKFNWIHPCVTYALSDVEVEVFPLLEKK